MAPTLQEPQECGDENVRVLGGTRVVISGVSGAYPRARRVKDLSDILYNKVDPIAECQPRWEYNHPEVPKEVGLIPDLENFDGQFFRVHYYLGINMDPMSRKLLEHVYQAIYDAGVNPEHLSGKKVAVFVGTCLSETEKAIFYSAYSGKTGLSIAGCSKSMFANRVSYWLNVKGPSHAIDAGCCSSAVALEQAYQAIKRGDCEAALVVGCNLCMHPETSVQIGRALPLCMSGKTKSYDQNADGCVRSEAINVLFLQRANDALRIYADVTHVKTSYIAGTSSGSWMRETGEVTRFFKEFYDEIKLSPSDVEYVEGFGAAVPEIDKIELEAIDAVFCKDRRDPLYVGSVMSNIGYLESASCLAAITKVILGYHTGMIAGNLHCSVPRDDLPALKEGRLKIMQDHKPTTRSYIAVNGWSVTGINSHVLLHGHYKPKDLSKYQSSIPRLVLISSRTEATVEKVIENLKSQPIDAEELALIQNIHSTKLNGHLGRGFTILDTDKESKTVSLCEKATYFDVGSRPLWFVYSGMGSQWAGMGAQLMRLPIFAAAIERCRLVLEPKGIDIVHIITSPDKTIYDNILHSFVGIAAVQIGLTDILLELGLVPDKIIGHSVGELGCAYADGCLTIEEMILSSYSRGLVSVETPMINGSMAAVGIGFKQVSKMCPPEIEVACHNSAESSTISGPAEVMSEFVAALTAQGIFAKEVPCSNIAYHSRYIANAGPGLLNYLKEVIKTPKLRSERWVSTSVPEERWTEEAAKYSSAEYHTNNLLSPVLFAETTELVPKNAVLVEVAPHGLLQAILKRSLPGAVHVPLTRRGHSDSVRFLLEAVGQLYIEGYYPDIRPLYPKVEFPVSTGTPHLSHLVEWAHQENWPLVVRGKTSELRKTASMCIFKISLHDDEYRYLNGHRIRGKTLFPFACALVCAWDTASMVAGEPRRAQPAMFRDVVLHSQPVMYDSRLLRLTVALQRGAGQFQITDGITKVATGYIDLNKPDTQSIDDEEFNKEVHYEYTSEDVYQMLNERGYCYRNEFQGILEVNPTLTAGTVFWSRWETFLDALLQLNVLQQPHDYVSQPAFIKEINIDTELHNDLVEKSKKKLKVNVSVLNDMTRCGGVTIKGIKFRHIEPPKKRSLVFDTSKFKPEHQIKNGVQSERISGNVLKGRTEHLESLHWVEASAEGAGILVKVHFAGLNSTDDVMKGDDRLTGQHYAEERTFGMDFSGTTENGTRVIGLVQGGAASSHVRARSELLWPVPAHWSLEDAATVPLAYAHALYCLGIKICLAQRSTILISGGAGVTSQAMIALALYCQCRVFVVVGDAAKKHFMLKLFPELDAEDVICCRDDSFVNRVLPATNGKGCKAVVCGGSAYKNAYLQCCGYFGYVIDTHQIQKNEMFTYGMHYLTQERSYISVDFSSLFVTSKLSSLTMASDDDDQCVVLKRKCRERRSQLSTSSREGSPHRKASRMCASGAPRQGARATRLATVREWRASPRCTSKAPRQGARVARLATVREWRASPRCTSKVPRQGARVALLAKELQLLIAEGISSGWVRPLTRVTLAPHEAGRALRLLARGAQRGRVLLRLTGAPPAELRLRCSSMGCQLVIGHSPGLAARLAERLVQRGARVLHLQLARTSTRLQLQVKKWRESGVHVVISTEDLSHKGCASKLLKQSLALGPVESVFVVITEPQTTKTSGMYQSLLDHLDAETRMKYPTIKYFAVIGVNITVGEQVCVSRAANQLPAMMLSLSLDQETDKETAQNPEACYNDIVDATDRGLDTMQPVITAHYLSVDESTLLRQIENIAGVTISDRTTNEQTLQDLGITAEKAQALGMFLRNQLNVTIEQDKLSLLTVEKLREIEAVVTESTYKPVEGLNAFFSFIDSDELQATIGTVVMPTLTQSSDMAEDEFDDASACLFIIPGLQGLHQPYRGLCERLKLNAIVLQPGLDNIHESLQEMAGRYAKMILKINKKRTDFYLLGHDQGVLAALEIAAALEDHGMTGMVFCLGGGPDEFVAELERQLAVTCVGAVDEATLQEAVARHMCALMGVTSPELDAALRDAATWPMKLETSVRALVGKVAYSKQYARLLIEAAYARVAQVRRGTRTVQRALGSRIVLLRSPSTLPRAACVASLQRYSCVPVAMHELRASLAQAADDLRAAAVVNSYLDQETSQCFANKSLCETYLTATDSFRLQHADPKPNII